MSTLPPAPEGYAWYPHRPWHPAIPIARRLIADDGMTWGHARLSDWKGEAFVLRRQLAPNEALRDDVSWLGEDGVTWLRNQPDGFEVGQTFEPYVPVVFDVVPDFGETGYRWLDPGEDFKPGDYMTAPGVYLRAVTLPVASIDRPILDQLLTDPEVRAAFDQERAALRTEELERVTRKIRDIAHSALRCIESGTDLPGIEPGFEMPLDLQVEALCNALEDIMHLVNPDDND